MFVRIQTTTNPIIDTIENVLEIFAFVVKCQTTDTEQSLRDQNIFIQRLLVAKVIIQYINETTTNSMKQQKLICIIIAGCINAFECDRNDCTLSNILEICVIGSKYIRTIKKSVFHMLVTIADVYFCTICDVDQRRWIDLVALFSCTMNLLSSTHSTRKMANTMYSIVISRNENYKYARRILIQMIDNGFSTRNQLIIVSACTQL